MARISKSNANKKLVFKKVNKTDLVKRRKAKDRKREYRMNIKMMKSDKELKEANSKRAEKERTRRNEERANMTLEEIEEDKLQVALKAKKRKLNIMKHKEKNPKGFVADDAYFLSEKFVKGETKKVWYQMVDLEMKMDAIT